MSGQLERSSRNPTTGIPCNPLEIRLDFACGLLWVGGGGRPHGPNLSDTLIKSSLFATACVLQVPKHGHAGITQSPTWKSSITLLTKIFPKNGNFGFDVFRSVFLLLSFQNFDLAPIWHSRVNLDWSLAHKKLRNRRITPFLLSYNSLVENRFYKGGCNLNTFPQNFRRLRRRLVILQGGCNSKVTKRKRSDYELASRNFLWTDHSELWQRLRR